MRRRTFLKHTAAIAGAAAAVSKSAPLLLGMEDKAGSKNPIIGKGEFQYECIHGWGELPRAYPVGNHPRRHDRRCRADLYHAPRPRPSCDGHNRGVRSQGKIRPLVRQRHLSRRARHRHLRKENGEQFLYMCDIDHRQVVKTNLKGDVVWKMDYPKEPGVYKNASRLQADERRLRPRRRLLCRRRLRLELHPSIRQGRQMGPHLGRLRARSPAS